jgi:hypothetical protein
MENNTSSSLHADARAIAWWVLVGAGSGAIAGFVVGGVGGRLAMLLLRLTSPDVVLGVTSDDGFEIGIVSTRSLGLVLGMTTLGAANGVLYAAVRSAIPRRLRLPLWVLFAAAVGGARVVHQDGVDFRLLEPAALAVALFVALPALAASLVVALVEHWVVVDPAERRRLLVALVVAAAAATVALLFAAGVGLVALLVRRTPGLAAVVPAVGRVVVPVTLVVLAALGVLDLARDASAIL